jgi:hypothetical protein
MTTPDQPAALEGNQIMHNTIRRSMVAGVLGVALVSAGGTAAQASGGGGNEVRISGHCSAASVWKLKVKKDNGALEVGFEVDSNRSGQLWGVTMSDNTVRFFSGSRLTTAPSGSFEVDKRTANRPGTDRIHAVATNAKTGERCSAVLTFAG